MAPAQSGVAAGGGGRVRDRLRAAPALVGRDGELAELLAGLDDAACGSGRLFLLAGDPGIGKSRLAGEAATRARDRGFTGVGGGGWEGGGATAGWAWGGAVWGGGGGTGVVPVGAGAAGRGPQPRPRAPPVAAGGGRPLRGADRGGGGRDAARCPPAAADGSGSGPVPPVRRGGYVVAQRRG